MSTEQILKTNRHATSSTNKISFTRKKKNNNNFREKLSIRNEFHKSNQSHQEKNRFGSFTKRKINMQQSARKKFDEQKACDKFHSQNQFHEGKNQYTSFPKRKINMQQVSRTEISFTRTKKLMYKIQEEKNQHATKLTNKNQQQKTPRTTISTQ